MIETDFSRIESVCQAVEARRGEFLAGPRRPDEFAAAVEEFLNLNIEGEGANPEYWRGGYEAIIYLLMGGEVDGRRAYLDVILEELT